MPKLTKRSVDGLLPNPDKHFIVWDDEIKGFGVRVMPTGRKTYLFRYRTYSKDRKIKIGVHGSISSDQARTIAKKFSSNVAEGKDPALEKQIDKQAPTVEELINEYLLRHAPKKRPISITTDKSIINQIIAPNFGTKKVIEITHHDIESLHLKLRSTPCRANRTLALLSKMFSLAVNWGWRDDNPVAGVEKYQEQKRDRWLSEDELARVWKILDMTPNYITSRAIKFLILTGARKGEALNATWNHFDFGQGIWTKPSYLTKQKKTEYLPLSEEALELLKQMNQDKSDSPYVFPGEKEGQPLKEIKKFWYRVRRDAGIEDVRIHDLRHTYASHLVSNGLSLSIVGKLLGHTHPSTTQRYAHLANETLKAAANVFGDKIKEIKAQ